MSKNVSPGPAGKLAEEFREANLGDERRRKRLITMAQRMERQPEAGLPEMMGSEASLEGCYRFLNNGAIGMEQILEPHYCNTVDRARQCDRILALHDETAFRFEHADQREAVGQLRSGGPGFYGHVSLAVDGTDSHRAVGITDASVHVRREDGSAVTESSGEARFDGVGNQWWVEHIERTEQRLQDAAESVVHVMDAGFEGYRRFSRLQKNNIKFIARLSTNRKVRREGQAEWKRLKKYVDSLEPKLTRQVTLSSRCQQAAPPAQQKKHPTREAREATLKLASSRIEIHRPKSVTEDVPEMQALQLVYVSEETDDDVEPVEWILLTNQPIETTDTLKEVVDGYQARWRIEQLYRALKTGCNYTDRQLENRRSLMNALGLSLVMAWLLLSISTVGRQNPEAPASWVIDDKHLEVLRAFANRPIDREKPTAEQITLAIAGLGGHLRSNGPPGWQTLSRGVRQLMTLTQGWQAAQQKM